MSHFNLYSRPRTEPTSAFRKDRFPVKWLLVDRDTGAVLGECQNAPKYDPTLPNRIAVPVKAVR